MPFCTDCDHCRIDTHNGYTDHMCMNPMARDLVAGEPTNCSTQRYADPIPAPLIQRCGPLANWFTPKSNLPSNIYTTGIAP